MCEKPSPHVIWSWGIALFIPLFILFGVGVWWTKQLPHPVLTLFVLFWVVGILLCGIWLRLRRNGMRFSIKDGYICKTSGVLIHTKRMIAMDAIRQVTLLQGPLERLCRTAFIMINSTGGYLLIEGIDQRLAEVWCRRLTPDG